MNPIFQTMAWFSDECLAFPPYVAAFNEIEFALRLYRETGLAQNILIVGDSGAGKTTLCLSILKKYPRFSLPDRDVVPVLYVETPTPATLVNLANAILSSLGDPGAHNGTLQDKKRRIAHFLRELKVEMIIFDETQHVQERGRQYTQYMAGDWLKQLVDSSKLPTVFVGLPQLEKLLQANVQLRRRFSRRRNLQLSPDNDSDSLTLCEQMPLDELLAQINIDQIVSAAHNQMNLFD
jgi:type II secretory pathway predicted ATPase ExeA